MYGKKIELSMSASATVTRKSLNGKLTAKIDFPNEYFMLPILHFFFRIWFVIALLEVSQPLNRKWNKNNPIGPTSMFEFIQWKLFTKIIPV